MSAEPTPPPPSLALARPKRLGLDQDRLSPFPSSSAGPASGPPTPAAATDAGANGPAGFETLVDPLDEMELQAFGIISGENTMPEPPSEQGAASKVDPARKALHAALAGRPKRPKNAQLVPSKGGQLVRRGPGNGGVSIGGGPDHNLPNNDFCDACGGKGHFLCCDGGCLRSFHFTCLDPPVDPDELPDESWLCKACRAAQDPPPKPPRMFFRELIWKTEIENPKAFALTPDLKAFYKHVATGAAGDFIDTLEHRPPLKAGRAVVPEDRDGYRVKDKNGKTIMCYNCGDPSSTSKQRKIVSCDFCEQHWHLDCLDPPMTGMPPPTRKWMCPLHVDHLLAKKRAAKRTQTIQVTDRQVPNNGDVIVTGRKEPPRMEDDYEETTVNRIRYQLPEETIILDFWGRVQSREKALHAPEVTLLQDVELNQISRQTSPVSAWGSSLDDVSDADPPSMTMVAAPIRYPSTFSERADTSALDALSMLAEGYYDHFVETQTAEGGKAANGGASGSSNGSESRAADDLSIGGGSEKGKARARLSVPGGSGSDSDRQHSPALASISESGPARKKARREGSASAEKMELEVTSKEDLQALGHVRKLLAETGSKEALLAFIEGAPVLPKLSYVQDKSKAPWKNSWEEEGEKETAGAAA